MKYLILLLSLTFCLNGNATTTTVGRPDIIMPPNPLRNVEYTPSDKKKVESLLKAAKTERKDEHPVIYFAKQFLGIPYVGQTLESGDREHLIVNLREMDCTTFVEYVLALSLCDKNDRRSFEDFCKYLTKIRYRDGDIWDYTSRLHYFTWWAEDNEEFGFVKDIAPKLDAKEVGSFTGIQTININYMTEHPDLYKHLKNNPSFVKQIKKYEQASNGKKYRYIPKSSLNASQSSSLGAVKSGDIIALLTDSDGLDTRHIAITYWQKGKLYFIHASSMYKKVLINKDSLYEYEKKQKKHTGIRVFRMQ